MGTSCRHTDDGEPLLPERVGELLDVLGEARERAAGQRIGAAEAGPADHDVADVQVLDNGLERWCHDLRRADRAVQVQHEQAVGRPDRDVGQPAAVALRDAVHPLASSTRRSAATNSAGCSTIAMCPAPSMISQAAPGRRPSTVCAPPGG